MTTIEALKLALAKEEASIKLYKSLALNNPAIKELLYILLNEEERHKKLIEEKIAKLMRG
ncbi:MAG: hypothetical protein PHW62_04295 [Candidatus Ratteibacteria bacterium]|nr:hypothetical protein [Candidatus Ratteibacteria bacterium]